MINPSRRPPRDPSKIKIDLRAEMVLGERDDPDGPTGGTTHWYAVARCGRGKNGLVGTFHFYVVDFDHLEDPTLDFSSSLQRLMTSVYDYESSGAAEGFLEKLAEYWLPRFLLCDLAELEPAWRGFGLGPVLAGMIIQQLSVGCAAVICEPDGVSPVEGRLTEAESDAVREKIIRAWESIGFARLDDRVFWLDPNLNASWDPLNKLKQEILG